MKKIKFMMPALAIASTAAAITPFVTSCKNAQGTTITHEAYNKKAIEYKPKYKSSKSKKFTKNFDLVKQVVQTINNDPAILCDDIMIHIVDYMSQPGTSTINVETLSLSVTNFSTSYRYFSPSVLPGTASPLLLSFDIAGVLDGKTVLNNKKAHQTMSLSFKNVPFNITPTNTPTPSTTELAYFIQQTQLMMNSGWSIEAKLVMDEEGEEQMVLEGQMTNYLDMNAVVLMCMMLFDIQITTNPNQPHPIKSNYFYNWVLDESK